MTIVLLLALTWLAANVALVLMLRRRARVRDEESGRASGAAFGRPPGRAAGRL